MGEHYIGIDIGTTNITVTALQKGAATPPPAPSLPNRRVAGDAPYAYTQDPHAIEAAVRTLLSEIDGPVGGICVTGQVHGILYYDKDGRACSPLYTWLDQRAMEQVDGVSSQEALQRASGVLLPPGYGLLTHYAHRRLGTVPQEAVGFCGILEYITATLTNTLPTLADPSCLGTYGGFDPVTSRFDHDLLTEVFGTDTYSFLEAAAPFSLAGTSECGAPVAHAVGDNQAGFFGMVSAWEQSALVSIGTSGQISLFDTSSDCPASMELRPFFGEGYLHVGATLTAGKAYETVQRLFHSVAEAVGATVSNEAIYTLMEEAAAAVQHTSLRFDPRLTGSRSEPNRRGSLSNITLDNLGIGEITLAAIEGVVAELWEFGAQASHLSQIVATGNAVLQNPLFSQALERAFGLPVTCAHVEDGAGFGAALIAQIAAGELSLDERRAVVQNILGT